MIDRLLTMSGYIVRKYPATVRDEYGNLERVAAGTHTPTGVYVEQVDAREITVNRETYTADHRGYLPAGTVVGPADHLLIDLVTYEVIGPPDSVFNPRTGLEHHLELNLRTVTG